MKEFKITLTEEELDKIVTYLEQMRDMNTESDGYYEKLLDKIADQIKDQ